MWFLEEYRRRRDTDEGQRLGDLWCLRDSLGVLDIEPAMLSVIFRRRNARASTGVSKEREWPVLVAIAAGERLNEVRAVTMQGSTDPETQGASEALVPVHAVRADPDRPGQPKEA